MFFVYLLTAEAMLCKLLLVTVGTVHVVVLGHEALGADWLFTLVAGETVLMPHVTLIVHVLRACRISINSLHMSLESFMRICYIRIISNQLKPLQVTWSSSQSTLKNVSNKCFQQLQHHKKNGILTLVLFSAALKQHI